MAIATRMFESVASDVTRYSVATVEYVSDMENDVDAQETRIQEQERLQKQIAGELVSAEQRMRVLQERAAAEKLGLAKEALNVRARGFRAEKEAQMKVIREKDALMLRAAIRIQTWTRAIFRQRAEKAAATRIQNWTRCVLRQKHEKAAACIQTWLRAIFRQRAEKAAATQIQAWARGVLRQNRLRFWATTCVQTYVRTIRHKIAKRAANALKMEKEQKRFYCRNFKNQQEHAARSGAKKCKTGTKAIKLQQPGKMGRC